MGQGLLALSVCIYADMCPLKDGARTHTYAPAMGVLSFPTFALTTWLASIRENDGPQPMIILFTILSLLAGGTT